MKKFAFEFSKYFLPAFLFALSYIFTIYERNISQVYLYELLQPIIISIIAVSVLIFISNHFLKNSDKQVIFSSFFVFIFFLYGDIWWNTNSFYFKLGQSIFGTNILLFPVSILVLGLFMGWLRHTTRSFNSVTKFLVVVSIIITLIPIIKIGNYERNQLSTYKDVSKLTLPIANQQISKDTYPDIYYIVPEDYSSFSVLKSNFNYDSSDFEKFLVDRGFYIATQSSSNYPKTFLSLTSSMNMEYLNYLSVHKNSSDQNLVNSLATNNNVLVFLRSIGYRFYQMGSWWGITKNNPRADMNYTLENQSNIAVGGFNYLLLSSSLFNPILEKLSDNGILTESDRDKWKRNEFQFTTLSNTINNQGPKMVFVHIISPHEPYVYGKNCEYLTRQDTTSQHEGQNYVNQINCLNQKFEAMIDEILSKSAKPPIIILQTDEGASFFADEISPRDSWEKAGPELLKDKFPILTAFYLPGVSHQQLYPQISPVNTFRLIFNLYFDTEIPLLPDINYIFPNLNNLYEFKDVTNIIQEESNSIEPTLPPRGAILQPETFSDPVEKVRERVTKKKFGTFVTPKNSPVYPERFSGYHTGIDFESSPSEKNESVRIFAICPGKLIFKKWVTGYGGVVVESCLFNKVPITITYGHLKLDSIKNNIGDQLNVGQPLAVLGSGYSQESDGERKHLHLSIHKGDQINLRGYVNSQNELDNWIDPCDFFCL